MIFTIPIRTVSEANVREHWAYKARRAKGQRSVVALAWLSLDYGLRRTIMAALKDGLTVTLTRIAPRELDDDNNSRAMKAVRDEIAKQLGIDDRSPLVKWQYGQQRSQFAQEYAVKVEIQ